MTAEHPWHQADARVADPETDGPVDPLESEVGARPGRSEARAGPVEDLVDPGSVQAALRGGGQVAGGVLGDGFDRRSGPQADAHVGGETQGDDQGGDPEKGAEKSGATLADPGDRAGPGLRPQLPICSTWFWVFSVALFIITSNPFHRPIPRNATIRTAIAVEMTPSAISDRTRRRRAVVLVVLVVLLAELLMAVSLSVCVLLSK